MKIEVYEGTYRHGWRGLADDETMLRIEGVNAVLTITEARGNFDISVNPSGSDFYNTLNVQEFAAHEHQARLIVRGERISEKPERVYDHVKVALANLAFSGRNASRTKLDVVAEAEAIARMLESLNPGSLVVGDVVLVEDEPWSDGVERAEGLVQLPPEQGVG